MGWPIPTLIKKDFPSLPNLWFWTILFILLQIITIIIGIFILNYENPKQIIGLCLIPTTLGWIILYVLWALKYVMSSLLVKYWNKEIQKADLLWKEWGKKKIAVLGNVILSPEDDGVNKLLKNSAPAFPQKGRSLYLHGVSFKEILQNIHQQLEDQYHQYDHEIEEIFLLLPETISSEINKYQNFIKQQWDNKTIHTFHNIEELLSIFDDDSKMNKLVLFISLQLWHKDPENYSEFITAQLLSPTSFIIKQNIKQIYGYIGRSIPLSLHNMDNDLQQFISYGCDDKSKIQSIWTNNISDDFNTNIIIKLGQHQISASPHNINYSFGPSGPLSLILTIATALEAKQQQQIEQLVLSKEQNNVNLYRIS